MVRLLGYLNYEELLDYAKYPILNDHTRNEEELIAELKAKGGDWPAEFRRMRDNTFRNRVSRMRRSERSSELGPLFEFTNESALMDAKKRFTFHDQHGNEIVLFHTLNEMSPDIPQDFPHVFEVYGSKEQEIGQLKAVIKNMETKVSVQKAPIDNALIQDIIKVFDDLVELFDSNSANLKKNFKLGANAIGKIDHIKEQLGRL